MPYIAYNDDEGYMPIDIKVVVTLTIKHDIGHNLGGGRTDIRLSNSITGGHYRQSPM